MVEQNSTEFPDEISFVMNCIYQDYHWDCGIACARMALSLITPEFSEANFDGIRQKLDIGSSVWTVDLAQMLHHLGVKNKLTTVTLGVDPTYKDVEFYTTRQDAEPFTKEEERINDIFRKSAEIGLDVEKRSVTTDEIVQHLSSGNPAIVLIDAAILRCLNCEKDRQCTKCSIWNGRPSKHYQGHYIVLSGYSLGQQQFHFKNPTYYEGLCVDCRCTFDNFDKARRSHGTDEDILFIYR